MDGQPKSISSSPLLRRNSGGMLKRKGSPLLQTLDDYVYNAMQAWHTGMSVADGDHLIRPGVLYHGMWGFNFYMLSNTQLKVIPLDCLLDLVSRYYVMCTLFG